MNAAAIRLGGDATNGRLGGRVVVTPACETSISGEIMRRESVEAVLLIALCACVVGAVVVWCDDRPTQSTWAWRIGLSVAAVVEAALLARLHFRRKADIAPDFLGEQCEMFFEQNGLCCSFSVTCEDGRCFVNTLFQNRYDRACTARIALRPVAGVLRSAVRPFRSDFPKKIEFDILCGPGEYGVASVPLAVSRRSQGKKLTLQIGASVEYREGRGNLLRFREGSLLGLDADFRNKSMRLLQLLFLVCGGFLFVFPACVTFSLPRGVAESVPVGQDQSTRILWKLGDSLV
jgi:hypothetical protein